MDAEPDPPALPASPGDRAILILRFAVGAIWGANLVYVVDPANNFFSGFGATAASLGGSALGGPGLETLAAHDAALFSVLLAMTTAYLCAAFLLGLTTRAACIVGAALSVVIFAAQWGTTTAFPGGTDIGPHPLYVAIYAALGFGGAGRFVSLDSVMARWRARRSSAPRPAGPTARPSSFPR